MGKNATYNLKMKMQSGKKVYGVEIGHGNEPGPTVEAVKKFGYDFIWVELENCLIGKETILEYIRLAYEYDLPIVMRPESKRAYFRPYLQAGINGLMLPQVETVDDVAYAIEEAYHPPIGRRDASINPIISPYLIAYMDRNNTPYRTLCEYINDNTVIIPLCERLTCMVNLPQMLRLEGVTGALFGPSDLCADIGNINPKHLTSEMLVTKTMVEKIVQMANICREAGKVAAMGGYPPKDLARWAKEGYSLFIMGMICFGAVDPMKARIEELKSLIE